eukprot:scaffold115120_cov31-Tisochrysis_lutea.AAC.5
MRIVMLPTILLGARGNEPLLITKDDFATLEHRHEARHLVHLLMRVVHDGDEHVEKDDLHHQHEDFVQNEQHRGRLDREGVYVIRFERIIPIRHIPDFRLDQDPHGEAKGRQEDGTKAEQRDDVIRDLHHGVDQGPQPQEAAEEKQRAHPRREDDNSLNGKEEAGNVPSPLNIRTEPPTSSTRPQLSAYSSINRGVLHVLREDEACVVVRPCPENSVHSELPNDVKEAKTACPKPHGSADPHRHRPKCCEGPAHTHRDHHVLVVSGSGERVDDFSESGLGVDGDARKEEKSFHGDVRQDHIVECHGEHVQKVGDEVNQEAAPREPPPLEVDQDLEQLGTEHRVVTSLPNRLNDEFERTGGAVVRDSGEIFETYAHRLERRMCLAQEAHLNVRLVAHGKEAVELSEGERAVAVLVRIGAPLVEQDLGVLLRHAAQAQPRHRRMELLPRDLAVAVRVPLFEELHDAATVLPESLLDLFGNRLVRVEIELDAGQNELVLLFKALLSEGYQLLGPYALGAAIVRADDQHTRKHHIAARLLAENLGLGLEPKVGEEAEEVKRILARKLGQDGGDELHGARKPQEAPILHSFQEQFEGAPLAALNGDLERTSALFVGCQPDFAVGREQRLQQVRVARVVHREVDQCAASHGRAAVDNCGISPKDEPHATQELVLRREQRDHDGGDHLEGRVIAPSVPGNRSEDAHVLALREA